MGAIGGDNLVVVIADLAGFFKTGVNMLSSQRNKDGEHAGEQYSNRISAGEY